MRLCFVLIIGVSVSACTPVADGLDGIAAGFRSFGDDVEHVFDDGAYKKETPANVAVPQSSSYFNTVRKVRGGSVTIYDIDEASRPGTVASLAQSNPDVAYITSRKTPENALPSQSPAFHEIANIYFGHGAANLDTKGKQIITDLGMLYQKKGGRYNVEGHASERAQTSDPVQRQILNLRTSMHRAVGVSEALIRQGVPITAIKTTAYGDAVPAEPTGDKTSEEASRRVEIYADDRDNPMTTIIDKAPQAATERKGYIPKLLREY